MIDDFKERHYWSTSQTSHIDCKSGMNKSFFLRPFISPTVTERLYNQCISATYMGSWGAKLPQSETGHMEQWLLNPGASRAPSGHKTWRLNLTARSFVECRNSSIYSLIHGTLHKKSLSVSPPSAWRSSGAAASYTISQLCSSAPLTAISGDRVMDAPTHWHIVFPTSAPCWHAPWLLLIIPWTLLFLKSSQIPLLVLHTPVIACLIPASDISQSTSKKPDLVDRWFDTAWF